jgi:long-chain acyl-CoA synthetase
MTNRLLLTIAQQAERYGAREAYRFCWRKAGEWLPTSWSDFAVQIDVAARALAALGLGERGRIAICSPNTPQILAAEFGAFHNRASAIPIYSSSSQQQFDFICSNGEAEIIFVGDSHQYPLAYKYWKTHPEIKKIVIFKNDGMDINPDDNISIFWDDFFRIGMEASDEVRNEVKRRTENGEPTDMATLIYTSGTTGEPKGVVLTHANYDAAIEMHLRRLDNVSDEDLSMAFLPMSHILEKAWVFFCLTKGIRIAFNYDPRTIQDSIHDVEPNIMCCVPRFWEKVFVGVQEKLRSMNMLQRIMVRRALKVGYQRNMKYKRLGLEVPSMLERRYKFWDKRLFYPLKKAIGIPNPNMFPTAGAPLSNRICEFMHSVGINVVVGYGLSETTATVTCFPRIGFEIGTVGTPLPEIDVKIAENGEILVKAPTVTSGYFKNDEANKAAFTADGYFRTGDAGYLDDKGALVLTERIKDLFKTSNGKYIAPQVLESVLVADKYIDEVVVIGENRKYVSALIVPNYHYLKKWAEDKKIQYNSIEELISNPKVVEMVMQHVDSMQSHMAPFEQIKRIKLLPNHFSVMNGEVTNTMKVRRPVVAKRYASEIESLYEN